MNAPSGAAALFRSLDRITRAGQLSRENVAAVAEHHAVRLVAQTIPI